MNIIEAVKSGQRFRRSNGAWIKPMKLLGNEQPAIEISDYIADLSYRDLIANDWEVDEEKIEITRSQIIDVLRLADRLYPSVEEFISQIVKKLGFKE